MIKKVFILGIILLALSGTVPVQAQEKLAVVTNTAEAEFPLKLHFNLSAESGVNITDIRLHYTTEQDSYARVTSEVVPDFVPGTTVNTQWTWDMRRTGGLPSGTSVEYWWTVKDSSGDIVTTTPSKVQFNDDRYSWQSLSEGEVTLYWYQADESLAREIMAATQQALLRLGLDTGAQLKKSVRIYLYTNASDLQGAMIFPQEWTGGVAFSRYGTIAIGLAPNDMAWNKRAITHELTHLVIHQMTFNPYNELPTWLNEGLAMYSEGEMEPGYTSLLNKAIAENKLISVRSLASPFSAFAGQATLAYAQSFSFVEFLISTYGQEMMLELLNTFNEGSSYDNALIQVYGFDMDGMNNLWRDYVVRRYQKPAATPTVFSPSLADPLTILVSGFLSELKMPVRAPAGVTR